MLTGVKLVGSDKLTKQFKNWARGCTTENYQVKLMLKFINKS